MTDTITAWQTALIELLSDEDDGLGIPFLAQRRDGISRERDIGCVFPGEPAWEGTNSGRSVFANFNMVVRVWRRFSGEPAQDPQPDPEEVNVLALQLGHVLQAAQTSLLDGMYFFVTKTRCDYPARGVEATLLGWSFNPAMLPVPTSPP